jgi:hypothetical protein
VKQLGDGGAVCVEVALCPLGNALTTPRDQDRLGETRVGILQLSKGELNATVREVFEELMKLALCRLKVSLSLGCGRALSLRTSGSLDLENTLLA